MNEIKNITANTGEPVTEQAPAVDTPSTTVLLGVCHQSIRSLSKDWEINYSTLWYRLKHGIEMCVALVAKDPVKLRFVGLDGKARYILNGSDRILYTARELIEKFRPDLLKAYDKHNPTGEYEPYKPNKEDITNG